MNIKHDTLDEYSQNELCAIIHNLIKAKRSISSKSIISIIVAWLNAMVIFYELFNERYLLVVPLFVNIFVLVYSAQLLSQIKDSMKMEVIELRLFYEKKFGTVFIEPNF